MKLPKFTESHMIAILKKAEAVIPLGKVCEEYEISKTTFYKWGSNYSGTDSSILLLLKALKREKARLKKMYVAQLLMVEKLQEDMGKEVILSNQIPFRLEFKKDCLKEFHDPCVELGITLVLHGLDILHRENMDLFKYHGNERVLAFHLGSIFERLKFCNIYPILRGYSVDSEYAKEGDDGSPKKIEVQGKSSQKLKKKRIVPDLIIHKRGSDSNNLLVIECKYSCRNKRGVRSDIEKLKRLTLEKRYTLGVFLVFLDSEQSFCVFFRQGKRIGSACQRSFKIDSV